MRDKEEHDARLKRIRKELKDWEKGGQTTSDSGLLLSMGAVLIVGTVILRFSIESWVFYPCALIWTVVSIILTWWVFRRYSTSWPEEMDSRLAQYHPADLRAWDELKQSVAEEGVTLEAVQRWADLELQAVTPSPAEKKWKMLQNKHGAQCTTTPEQPVKPDTKEE